MSLSPIDFIRVNIDFFVSAHQNMPKFTDSVEWIQIKPKFTEWVRKFFGLEENSQEEKLLVQCLTSFYTMLNLLDIYSIYAHALIGESNHVPSNDCCLLHNSQYSMSSLLEKNLLFNEFVKFTIKKSGLEQAIISWYQTQATEDQKEKRRKCLESIEIAQQLKKEQSDKDLYTALNFIYINAEFFAAPLKDSIKFQEWANKNRGELEDFSQKLKEVLGVNTSISELQKHKKKEHRYRTPMAIYVDALVGKFDHGMQTAGLVDGDDSFMKSLLKKNSKFKNCINHFAEKSMKIIESWYENEANPEQKEERKRRMEVFHDEKDRNQTREYFYSMKKQHIFNGRKLFELRQGNKERLISSQSSNLNK